jgi:hypothetical protein
LCILSNNCASLPLTTRLVVTADVDNRNGKICAFGANGAPLRVTCESPATVECTRVLIPSSAETGVRITGNGSQGPKLTSAKVLTAKNSGQVEGPMGVPASWDAHGSCVVGSWEHLRMERRSIRGVFRTEAFDSFMAACLPCADKANGVVMAGIICDPADQGCGRDQRKSGGNKVSFSGIGEYGRLYVRGKTTNEVDAFQPVLFRVDIEDRNEPKGKGKTVKGERYRIRIWKLTEEEIARLNDPNDGLREFREKISCTAESAAVRDGGQGSLGSAVMDVRAPDIDDGGVQDSGNHKIQPVPRSCP